MSLEYLLLGFLNQKVRSGYDLHKDLGDIFEYGWKADRRQIYYLLHKMEDKKWLEVEVIPQDDNPNKKIYHITPLGQEKLKLWIKTPLNGETAPFNWMGQLYLGYEVEIKDIIHVLENRCAQLEERIAAGAALLEEINQAVAAGANISKEMMFQIASLHHGFTYATTELQWARFAIEQFSELNDGQVKDREFVMKFVAQIQSMRREKP